MSVHAGTFRSISGTAMAANATLGVRALREDYCKPSNRAEIPRNLNAISEALEVGKFERVASQEREDFPRFRTINGAQLLFDPEDGSLSRLNRRKRHPWKVLVLRDNLVISYKALVAKIRQKASKEIDRLPDAMLRKFASAWHAWESAWLRNREVHAERLLPWPRVQHQKAITLKCLEGFVHAFGELAASVLPSNKREKDHDARLLLLMDHVLSLRGPGGEKLKTNSPARPYLLEKLSSAPNVLFPDHQVTANEASTLLGSHALAPRDGQGVPLESYAFKLLGTSGEANQANARGEGNARGGDLAQKAADHANELLSAFESLQDMLMSLKSTLEHIDPALDKDDAFTVTSGFPDDVVKEGGAKDALLSMVLRSVAAVAPLPDECWQQVLSNLEATELSGCISSSCQRMSTLSENPELWQMLLRADFSASFTHRAMLLTWMAMHRQFHPRQLYVFKRREHLLDLEIARNELQQRGEQAREQERKQRRLRALNYFLVRFGHCLFCLALVASSTLLWLKLLEVLKTSFYIILAPFFVFEAFVLISAAITFAIYLQRSSTGWTFYWNRLQGTIRWFILLSSPCECLLVLIFGLAVVPLAAATLEKDVPLSDLSRLVTQVDCFYGQLTVRVDFAPPAVGLVS
eukprot:s6045_g1.t2